jgi:hypothetical protein
MCTVPRLGLASIASSTAIKLPVSLLQHPDGYVLPCTFAIVSLLHTRPCDDGDTQCTCRAATDASTSMDTSTSASSVLGLGPHQFRGFLALFRTLLISGATRWCHMCMSNRGSACCCVHLTRVDIWRGGVNRVGSVVCQVGGGVGEYGVGGGGGCVVEYAMNSPFCGRAMHEYQSLLPTQWMHRIP